LIKKWERVIPWFDVKRFISKSGVVIFDGSPRKVLPKPL